MQVNHLEMWVDNPDPSLLFSAWLNNAVGAVRDSFFLYGSAGIVVLLLYRIFDVLNEHNQGHNKFDHDRSSSK